MKIFYTSICFILFSLSIQAQFQLDSIVSTDLATNTISDYTLFTYTNGLLNNYVDGYEEDEAVNVVITYNELDQFDKFIALEEGYMTEIIFVYDDNNDIDSLFLNFSGDDGYSSTQIYDYLVEDSKIIESKISESYGSYAFDSFLNTYDYDDEDKLINHKIFDLYNGSPELDEEYIIKYTDQNLVDVIDYKGQDGELISKDSIIYDANNSITNYYELSYYGGPMLDAETTFESDGIIPFDDIASPAVFFETLRYIDFFDFNSTLIPMQSNKINSSTTLNSFEEIETIWYYSLFTGIIKNPIVAIPIVIYPNPTVDFLQFKTEKQINNYTIYSMNGQVLKTGEMTSDKISVTDIPTGKYTIVGQDNEGENYFAAFVKM